MTSRGKQLMPNNKPALVDVGEQIHKILERLSSTIALNHEGRKASYGAVRKEDDLNVAITEQALLELMKSVIGEDDEPSNNDVNARYRSEPTREWYRNQLRAEQRAKLTPTTNIGEKK